MVLSKQKLRKLIEEVLTERRDCDSAVKGVDLRGYHAERRPDGILIVDNELLGRARTHGQKGLKLSRKFAKEQKVYDAWVEGMLEYINWVDRCDPDNPLPPNFMGHHYHGYEQ